MTGSFVELGVHLPGLVLFCGWTPGFIHQIDTALLAWARNRMSPRHPVGHVAGAVCPHGLMAKSSTGARVGAESLPQEGPGDFVEKVRVGVGALKDRQDCRS